MSQHIAVILIALGGPRSLRDVESFMTAFMGRPASPEVVEAVVNRYKLIGGKSPLPELVKAQAEALTQVLHNGFRIYEGFRYSHPTIAESFEKAINDGATHIIGMSLSPFEADVTTGVYRRSFEHLGSGTNKKTFIASWHNNHFFIEAWKERLQENLQGYHRTQNKDTAIIFTSHSIPLRYIKEGDPYQQQIEEAVKLIVDGINIKYWHIAWQSKSARATEPWLEPTVESTLDKIKQEGFAAVLEVPIGFTCDHLETLYDIDIVHRMHAKKLGLQFDRTKSLNTSTMFIKALADIVRKSL
ncbi:MAG TPA: ferrochelatase [Nitrospirota bacterium]|nr:ferrochelatase [Nitrospirota bacterium]